MSYVPCVAYVLTTYQLGGNVKLACPEVRRPWVPGRVCWPLVVIFDRRSAQLLALLPRDSRQCPRRADHARTHHPRRALLRRRTDRRKRTLLLMRDVRVRGRRGGEDEEERQHPLAGVEAARAQPSLEATVVLARHETPPCSRPPRGGRRQAAPRLSARPTIALAAFHHDHHVHGGVEPECALVARQRSTAPGRTHGRRHGTGRCLKFSSAPTCLHRKFSREAGAEQGSRSLPFDLRENSHVPGP